jgi:hypothetical protein
MDKKEYFKISEEKNIPNRCPILSRCQRRASSIFLLTYSNFKKNTEDWEADMIKMGELPEDYKENRINIQGELPVKINGTLQDTHGHYSNLCPEVNLFDQSHNLLSEQKAWVTGSWDKYYKTKDNFITSEFKHYNQCSEYCHYLSEEKIDLHKEIKTINSFDLKILISENIEAGIKEMLEIIKAKKLEDQFDNLILIKSDYQDFKNYEIRGTMSFEQQNIKKSKIVLRLLNLVSIIDKK